MSDWRATGSGRPGAPEFGLCLLSVPLYMLQHHSLLLSVVLQQLRSSEISYPAAESFQIGHLQEAFKNIRNESLKQVSLHCASNPGETHPEPCHFPSQCSLSNYCLHLCLCGTHLCACVCGGQRAIMLSQELSTLVSETRTLIGLELIHSTRLAGQ